MFAPHLKQFSDPEAVLCAFKMSNFKAKVEITTSPSAEGDEFIQSIPTGYWSDDSPIQPTRPEKRPRVGRYTFTFTRARTDPSISPRKARM